MENKNPKVLFIDNFDSFTYNLVDDFCKRDCIAKVYRADTPLETLKKVAQEFKPDLLVISPGPGNPSSAGVTLEAIGYFKDLLPIFGVCLGHQAIGAALGGQVVRAPKIMHGKVSDVYHDSRTIFRGIGNPFVATRYHSLVVSQEGLPDCLEVSARTEEGVIMGLRHRTFVLEGVQFHPESILTAAGKKILSNFIQLDSGKRDPSRSTE